MIKLSNNDIKLNSVDTINQFKILQYLKQNLDIKLFDIYLYDRDTIKVIDSKGNVGYFIYKNKTIKYKEYTKALDR